MQSNVNNLTAANIDLAVNDLGPLAWVLEELRKSLDGSAKALKRFVRDAEAAIGSDLAAIDASQLRIARQQLHQAVGALEMVGLAAPALVLRAMEAAVQRFVQHPEQCNQDAAAKHFDRLALVAPAHVMHDLRHALSHEADALLVGFLQKDLVKVPDAEIGPHLTWDVVQAG